SGVLPPLGANPPAAGFLLRLAGVAGRKQPQRRRNSRGAGRPLRHRAGDGGGSRRGAATARTGGGRAGGGGGCGPAGGRRGMTARLLSRRGARAMTVRAMTVRVGPVEYRLETSL